MLRRTFLQSLAALALTPKDIRERRASFEQKTKTLSDTNRATKTVDLGVTKITIVGGIITSIA